MEISNAKSSDITSSRAGNPNLIATTHNVGASNKASEMAEERSDIYAHQKFLIWIIRVYE